MEKKKGKLTIVTQVDDGAEQSVSYDAEIDLTAVSAVLRYQDGQSSACIKIDREEVLIERTGDYLISLRLKENEKFPASLGVAGNVGQIFTHTDSIKYAITKTSVLLTMQYSLLFSDTERQRMKIRLHARQNDYLEEK